MWDLILVAYFSGVVVAMATLYYPSYKVIKATTPNNILVQKPILSTLVVLLIFCVAFPFVVYSFLFEEDKFIKGFARGVTGKDEI
jgi:hypothetical protein